MAQNNRPYVLWRRVSTKQQGDSELGLKAQIAIAEYFMHSEAEKVFTDVYTGTKLSECKNLWEAIKFCKENGYLLVIAKTDRFRNVAEALNVLDEIGEGNLVFCDLPTTDRTVLTIVFALWERQAIQGRINTRVALEERKKMQQNGERWVSKTGRECDRLGRPADGVDKNGKPYWDVSAMVDAASAARQEAAILWREQSKAVIFVRRKKAEGWTLTQITDELGKLYDEFAATDGSANPYATPNGCKPSKGTVSKWCREMNPLAV